MIAVPLSKVLSVVELRRKFQETVAVDSVSFDVGQGEIVGLLGPNGAGKTTTINMILGLLEPTAGTISIEGVDIARHRSRALERTNFAASYTPLPGNLTVRQNLKVFALLYHLDNLSARIEELIDLFRLRRFRDVKCGLLSSGEQARVSLAKAMLNRPRLLLLDEPTVSLDPATAAVWPIPALITPFAGVFYPVATLPHWMGFISRLLPPSHVFEGMRTIIAHGAFPISKLLQGGCLTLLYLCLACLVFRRVYRQAVRTGLIARYSAESVG